MPDEEDISLWMDAGADMSNKKPIVFDLWLYLIAGFIGITSTVYGFAFLINDEIDWTVLLHLTPTSYIPILEESMVLFTDFSIFVFSLIFLAWEVMYQISIHFQQTGINAQRRLKTTGTIIAFITATGYFWAGYVHPVIFFPLALIILIGFFIVGNILTRYDKKKLEQINHIFWITLSAVLLSELSAECFIKEAVGRPRPLSDVYAVYNLGIHRVVDEIVLQGNSYVAGHSAVFFGMITPMMCLASKKTVKVGLFLWASIHAFSRIYLAAHFPYCDIMGSVLGFCMAVLVVKIFGTHSEA